MRDVFNSWFENEKKKAADKAADKARKEGRKEGQKKLNALAKWARSKGLTPPPELLTL